MVRNWSKQAKNIRKVSEISFSNFVAKKSLTPNFFRKKVFFPYFFSRKNLHPIIFSKKSLCPQFFSKKILRPPCRLSRPGYPKNFDLSRLHFFYKTAWAQALENQKRLRLGCHLLLKKCIFLHFFTVISVNVPSSKETCSTSNTVI